MEEKAEQIKIPSSYIKVMRANGLLSSGKIALQLHCAARLQLHAKGCIQLPRLHAVCSSVASLMLRFA